MEKIKWTANEMPKTEDKYLPLMSKEKIEKALAFHKSFPQYSETPLAELNHMAAYLGLNDFFVKDESYRFGLNAFKVLGGSFAMANYIAEKLKKDVSELTYDELTSDQLRSAFGQATFFTATDGNHGRGVAWAANKLGQKSVVLMPKGSTQTRKKILKKKAQPSQSKKLITMNVCEWLIKWPKKLKTVSWFKTPLGTDMKKFRLGLCKDTERWR